jgi:uncharacterized protein YcbX
MELFTTTFFVVSIALLYKYQSNILTFLQRFGLWNTNTNTIRSQTGTSSSKKSTTTTTASTSNITISQIYVHPIKSCAPIAVDHVSYNRLGLQYDRNWMILNAPKQGSESPVLSTFFSQRNAPKMALLKPRFDLDNQQLIIDTEGRESLKVPMFPSEAESYIEDAKIWEDTLKVRVYANENINKWLSDYLQQPARLATILNMKDHSRPLDTIYDPNPSTKKIHAAFSDNYPMLLASTASLADLNKKLTHRQVPMQAFRPNIVLTSSDDSLKPWAEDYWTHVEIQSSLDQKTHRFQLVKACDRCTLPNVIPETGTRDPLNQPGVLLHQVRALNPENENKVYFGVFAVQSITHGSFSVGDRVIPIGKKQTPLELPVIPAESS